MSHTEKELPSDALKRHFANRVTNQVRVILNRWRIMYDHPLTLENVEELRHETDRLIRRAMRFGEQTLLDQAHNIEDQLIVIQQPELLNNEASLTSLHSCIYQLGQESLRRNDNDHNVDQHIPNKQPVILAVNDDLACKLSEQLSHFDINSLRVRNSEHFSALIKQYEASAFIVDIHFQGPNLGIMLMETWEKETTSISEQALSPSIIFLTHEHNPSIEQRLAACRVGGERFLIRPSVSQLIRSVEKHYSASPFEPYRVLIMDDSRSQALFCEKALTAAGMLTHMVTDPMSILNAMEDFEPEIIVMDMYMPGCTGNELASVIRQQTQYLRLPILFLSAEDDKEIQLKAMGQGGDDFLTKPINPIHLSTTVQNRAQRARVLNNLIVRDSLTGLFNHTHILDRLSLACRKARENNTMVCFAMVDIDFFKKVNDNYGHPVGDKVISALSLFLKQRLRKTDSIGRYGGEEFAVILPNTSGEDALHVMNDIREVFSQLEHSADEIDFKVSFSCGVCSFTGSNIDTIVKEADEALYEAKRQGRNNVQLYFSEP
jgi:diguanylate cyclase (GGDEF)-like protein